MRPLEGKDRGHVELKIFQDPLVRDFHLAEPHNRRHEDLMGNLR